MTEIILKLLPFRSTMVICTLFPTSSINLFCFYLVLTDIKWYKIFTKCLKRTPVDFEKKISISKVICSKTQCSLIFNSQCDGHSTYIYKDGMIKCTDIKLKTMRCNFTKIPRERQDELTLLKTDEQLIVCSLIKFIFGLFPLNLEFNSQQ